MSIEDLNLVSGNILNMLSESDNARLLEAGRLRSVKANEELARQGTIGDCLFVVVEGELVVVRCLPGDEEKILFIAKPGMMVGEVAVLDGGARTASLRASCDAMVREIELGAFKAVTLHGLDSGHRILHAVASSVHERLKVTRQIAGTKLTANTKPPQADYKLEWSEPDSDVINMLSILPPLADLSYSDWKMLMPHMSTSRIESGTEFELPQNSTPGVIIVLRGALSPWLNNAIGPEVVMPAIGPGYFVDYAAALGFSVEQQRWRARSSTYLLRLDPVCFESKFESATRLLYILSSNLATMLRRSTGLYIHFCMAYSNTRNKLQRDARQQSRKITEKTDNDFSIQVT